MSAELVLNLESSFLNSTFESVSEMEEKVGSTSCENEQSPPPVSISAQRGISNILPEIWERIFKDLSPKDFLSVINSCLEWNQLMHTKKTHFLFPLILPLVLEYLPLNSILTLRLGNKDLKRRVDLVFQNLSTNSLENFEYEPTRLFGVGEFTRGKNSLAFKVESVREKFVVDSVDLIQKLVEQQQQTDDKTGSPFFAKYLCTILGVDGVDQDDGESLRLMLQRFGDQISSLHIGITRIIPGITAKRLISSLAYLPNLKIIQLEARIPRQELEEFNIDMLPNLPNLESLCVQHFIVQDSQGFGDGSRLDSFLILPFLHRYGQQLKVLKCSGRFFDSKEISVDVLNNLVPNLKLLKVSYLNPLSMIKLTLLRWNLETLNLMGYTRYEKRCCRLADVIRVINNFGMSLKTLELIVQWPYQEKVDEDELIMLPLLRKLTVIVEYLEAEWFWQFLKFSCEKVKELDIRVVSLAPRGYEFDAVETFSFVEYKTLFEFLPKLQRIVLWYNCKRKVLIRCRNQFCNLLNCNGSCLC